MSNLHTMNDVVNGLREIINQRESRIKELEKENTAWQNQNLLEQCNDQADRIKELEDGLEKGKDYCVSLSKTVTELTIENESRYKRIKELEAVVEQRNAESQIASEEINRMLSDFLESVRATLNASRNWSQ